MSVPVPPELPLIPLKPVPLDPELADPVPLPVGAVPEPLPSPALAPELAPVLVPVTVPPLRPLLVPELLPLVV
jgi:hypothetical protein